MAPGGLQAEVSDEDTIMPTVNTYREGIKVVVERSRAFTGWTAASVKVILLSDQYVPSQTHSSKADLASFEITGGDYIAGGQLLTSKSVSTSTNQVRLAAENVAWNDLPVKPRYAAVYDDTNATVSDKTLFAYMDLGTLHGRKLRIRWPAAGVLVYTVEDAVGLP
jgi:hypothetical protein